MPQIESFKSDVLKPEEVWRKESQRFRLALLDRCSGEDSLKVNEALDFMELLYSEGDARLEARPYVSHAIEVARHLLVDFGIKDRDLLIAGILHDMIEDESDRLALFVTETKTGESSRPAAEQALRAKYGDHVTGLILKLSNPETVDKSKKNEIYLEHLKELVKDPEAATLKYADFSTNALRLDMISDPKRQARLKEKYAPAIKDVFIPLFENMPSDHPLFPYKDQALMELRSSYEKYYQPQPEVAAY
jgi:(p)ppGpp synthase/HD superfamily hydrolase